MFVSILRYAHMYCAPSGILCITLVITNRYVCTYIYVCISTNMCKIAYSQGCIFAIISFYTVALLQQSPPWGQQTLPLTLTITINHVILVCVVSVILGTLVLWMPFFKYVCTYTYMHCNAYVYMSLLSYLCIIS